jgi:hypothetical protein
MRPQLRRPDAQGCRANPFDFGADVEEQPCHHLDVADARDVSDHALVARQEARRQQRQRRVLVSLDRNRPLEAIATFDQQCRHV